MTPVYLVGNLGEMFEHQTSEQEPSEDLLREARYQLALAASLLR